jgi:hypothetical protein
MSLSFLPGRKKKLYVSVKEKYAFVDGKSFYLEE